MNEPENSSRRKFLASASGAAGTGWLALQWPALISAAGVACSRREAGAQFAHIEPLLAATLEAMAEQIIPADTNGPGAREAGVIWFIDQWLGSDGKNAMPRIEKGAMALDAGAGGEGQFAQLSFGQQTEALKRIESGSFFNLVRFLTIVGMFAMTRHGGNANNAGWELIGFEDQHAWAPPFGYYDVHQDAIGESGKSS